MNKSINNNFKNILRAYRRGLVGGLLVLLSLCGMQSARADYVGESQTSNYLDPATQAMIAARYQAGGTLQVGDQIAYIISFIPVPGTGVELIGGGVYVTDYIPAGTQVVKVEYVQDNGNGTFTTIAPPPPPEVSSVFVPEYSETGIFYSTDPRTAMYTNNASTTITATNGYAERVVGGGPAVVTAGIHNAWDFYMNSATPLPDYTVNPAVVAGCTVSASTVPSPVVGADTFITQDGKGGGVGPWHRIYYPNSTIGTASGVPGTHLGCIGGATTSAGWPISVANPLPASVNAVRWAGGIATIGAKFAVRITLQITQPIPATGLINNSEVYGGDVSILNTGLLGSKSTDLKYIFPSAANSNSVMLLLKTIIGMCAPVAPATTCTIQPYSGASVPSIANLNLRYQVTYLNASGGPQVNVNLSDVLPTGATLAASSVTIVGGPNILPTTAVAGGFNFAPLAVLGSGQGGTVQYTVSFATAPPANVALVNIANLNTAAVSGVTSAAATTPTTLASLNVNKVTTTPNVAPGGVASYTITLPNNGAASATAVTIVDTLPSDGLSTALSDRFSYASGVTTTATLTSASGVVTTVTPVTAVVTPPTVTPFQEKVTFAFPAATTIPPGAILTLNFNANVGSGVPAISTSYLNNVQVNYTGGVSGVPTTLNGVAPVTVTVPLSLSKSIACVYSGALCVPYSTGATIPTASKVKYQLTYSNTSAAAIASVVVKDTLPLNTSFVVGSASEVVGTGLTTFGTVVPPTVAGQVMTFGTIASLPASAVGAVTFDVQLAAASAVPSGSYLTNNATISSTTYPGGVSAFVTTMVQDRPNLIITKTTSTPTIAVGGSASYTLTVTNTGNVAASGITVYDALPFASSVASTSTRFNYAATGAYTLPAVPSTLTASSVVIASSVGATNIAPYNANLNQQVVSWTFTASQVLAPGASFTIPFTAVAGSGIAASTTSYLNNAVVTYASGVYSASVTNAAAVTIPSNLTITKAIDCVYSGAVCNAYNGTGVIPVNAKVRYHIHYANTGATAQTNVYLCDQLPVQASAVPIASVITPPTTAPVPTGPYTNTATPNGPPVGALTSPAIAACGITAVVGATSFNYPVIPSLAANTSGDVFYDVPLTMTNGTNMTNTAKVVTTQAPAGASTQVSAVATNVPILSISKTTSTPTIAAGGVATYTIAVTNTGSGAVSSVQVYDFLPFSGTVADATKRFNYVTTTGYTLNGTAYTPTGLTITSAVPPTITPYNANINQMQVQWNFSTASAVLAPGSTLAITFTAAVGSAVPATNYLNSVGYSYTSSGGSGSNNVNGLASVAIAPPPLLTIQKTVAAFSDPINGTTNPLFLPGGVAQYTVTVSNAGGPVDNNTVIITDSVPPNTSFYLKDLGVVGSGPIAFTANTSGLTYTYPANISYYGITAPATLPAWGYVPVVGANGCDPNVQQFRITPQLIFAGSVPPATANNFNFNFRVCLQ